jgi:FKBP-type peptidyl-prolyl cis-trans isomerase 2
MTVIKKNDFVEIRFTGYSQGKIFDSNVEADLKQINPNAKPQKTALVVGHGMLVGGFDKALEGKEVGKEYTIELKAKDAFGERKKDLLKTIPLKVFTEKKIQPYPGLVLTIDDMLAKIITVSGARVVTDFNNPLSGKDVSYKFTVIKKIDDEKEKVQTLFEVTLGFAPEFEIKDNIVIKGPKEFEALVKALGSRFKELLGKDLKFELKEEKKNEVKVEDKKEEKTENKK